MQQSMFSDDELEKVLKPALKLPKSKRSIDEARIFHGWTQHKLEILRIYLILYRRVAGNGTYIDGFAGDGRIEVDNKQRDGSASVALKSGAFKTFHLYERPMKAKRLRKWVDTNAKEIQKGRTWVVGGDFNQKILEDLASGAIPIDRPCFAFLDPDSTELDWKTVEAIATYKGDCSPPETCKVELWILLNTYQVLLRLMPKKGPPNEQTLNRWLGGAAGWRDLYDAGNRVATAYATRYADRLVSEFGYGAAIPITIRDPKSDAPQYHMIHASDHPAAHDFMRWATLHAHPDDSTAVQFPGLTNAG
jgi:three-Cys-motif partner protein